MRPEVSGFGGEAVEGAPVRLQEQLPAHQRLVRRLEAHLKHLDVQSNPLNASMLGLTKN